MSEQKAAIPEDLRERHAALSVWVLGPVNESTKMPEQIGLLSELILIERIATLEAARDDAEGRYLACYNELTKVQADLTSIKSTVASLLSIDDSKVAEYVVLSPGALQAAAGNRVAELEAKVAALQWQLITPENLPNRGDEALEMGTDSHGARVIPVGFDSREGDCERYTHAGFTHFRPINPPAKETE